MRITLLLSAGLMVLPLALAAAEGGALDWLDKYNVVWDSPSENALGSMPLGNGEIGLNAWAEKDGSVQFIISRTDAWDDNARLVKVGKVRVQLDPNPFVEGKPFKQTLSLRDATLKIEAGEGDAKTAVQLWADANNPVVHVTFESGTPVEATASIELWRTKQQEYAELQCSDIMTNAPAAQKKPTIIEPDVVLKDQKDRIDWYHHNAKSFGPQILAEIQGLTDFKQQDPLLNRTFGGVITAAKGERLDDLRLRSAKGTHHSFDVFVVAKYPSTPEQWLSEMDETIRKVEATEFKTRRSAHETWWNQFWNRSFIRATSSEDAKSASIVPANNHPVKAGMDQSGVTRFEGELGRISVFARALSDKDIAALAEQSHEKTIANIPGQLHSGNDVGIGAITGSNDWDFAPGLTVEAWLKPEKLSAGGGRIADKITIGGSDGFLLDTHPGNSLRFICGSTQLNIKDALPAGTWTHVAATADPKTGSFRIYVNGKQAAAGGGQAAIGDEAVYVSQMYHLQRFIAACSGRGNYPIKFNGSIFTMPPDPKHDPDYRRWGPGYWWQNTRLPYYSMAMAGDYEMMQPLFKMYAGEVLEMCKYRTKLYCGHDGAYFPECIYFWGPMFSETYGWTPWNKRGDDKIQASGWHKWEWVGALELCWLMLDYYEHTLDREFLTKTAIPTIHEVLTFFEQHYKTNEQGKLVMHPAQALETWWACTNAMPEVAGCLAVTERALTIGADSVPAAERTLWQRLHDKMPAIPTREINGKKALAPAEKFDKKSNCENPELYAVFPFRLFALNRPNVEWGIEALHNRGDKGHSGWRQDDMFMAYLGLTDEAKGNLVARARSHDPSCRFPAFWGPNYDWTPDQDHGSNLLTTYQVMLMQTDGKKIILLPAWPATWDAEFRLRAPFQTVVEGKVRGGKVIDLQVTPKEREKDVEVRGAEKK
ncbi:MAG TPA: DUF5703 domain-containing protein [Planctomycetota bacterium]|jgi:hypothetical protein